MCFGSKLKWDNPYQVVINFSVRKKIYAPSVHKYCPCPFIKVGHLSPSNSFMSVGKTRNKDEVYLGQEIIILTQKKFYYLRENTKLKSGSNLSRIINSQNFSIQEEGVHYFALYQDKN